MATLLGPNGSPMSANGNGTPSLLTSHQKDMIFNAMFSRTTLINKLMDARRDYDAECGYLATENITPEILKNLHDRDPVACRVNEIWPKECWSVSPTVYEDEDSETVTEFEESWDNLSRQLRGDSLYQDEEGSPIWEALYRADVLSGIGHYGVLLLGLDDGKELSEPVEDTTKERRLLYLMPFDQSNAQITSLENDKKSARYGMPVGYSLRLNDPTSTYVGSIQGFNTQTLNVHHTRVIHLADNLTSSIVYGVPRTRPVYNRIQDLRKLYGGSAEMYWKGAFPGIAFETQPQLGSDITIDRADLKDQYEQYINGLQRVFALTGINVKTLAPQVADPTAQIRAHLEAICIVLGIPMRIFLGSERGELASSQDSGAWDGRVAFRRIMYLTPKVIVPFVDRLIKLGVLRKPKGFSVFWNNKRDLTEGEQADLATKRINAVASYVQSGAENAGITPLSFFTRFLGMDEDEAKTMIEEGTEQVEETPPDPMFLLRHPEIQQMQAQQSPMPGEAFQGPIDPEQLKSMTDEEILQFVESQGVDPSTVDVGEIRKEIEALTLENQEATEEVPEEEVPEEEDKPGANVEDKSLTKREQDEVDSILGDLVSFINEGIQAQSDVEYEDDIESYVGNIFCATGEGGGIDPTCTKGETGGASGSTATPVTAKVPGLPDVASAATGGQPPVKRGRGRPRTRPRDEFGRLIKIPKNISRTSPIVTSLTKDGTSHKVGNFFTRALHRLGTRYTPEQAGRIVSAVVLAALSPTKTTYDPGSGRPIVSRTSPSIKGVAGALGKEVLRGELGNRLGYNKTETDLITEAVAAKIGDIAVARSHGASWSEAVGGRVGVAAASGVKKAYKVAVGPKSAAKVSRTITGVKEKVSSKIQGVSSTLKQTIEERERGRKWKNTSLAKSLSGSGEKSAPSVSYPGISPQTPAPQGPKPKKPLVDTKSGKRQKKLKYPPFPYGDDIGEGTRNTRQEVDNVFCATGKGGGIDPSCKLTESQRIVKAAAKLYKSLTDTLGEDNARHILQTVAAGTVTTAVLANPFPGDELLLPIAVAGSQNLVSKIDSNIREKAIEEDPVRNEVTLTEDQTRKYASKYIEALLKKLRKKPTTSEQDPSTEGAT